MVIVLSIAAVMLALLILFALSHIRVRVRFIHAEDDEHLSVDLLGLFGLLRYRYVVPVIRWKGMVLQIWTEIVNAGSSELLSGQWMTVTKETILRYFERSRRLLEHTAGFREWIKGIESKVVCTELNWTTRLGLDDAPKTAIAAGVVWGLKASIVGIVSRRIVLKAKPNISVQPQYNRHLFSTEALFIGKIRAVYALAAGILLLIRILKTKDGVKTWRKILSKPS